MVGFGALEGNVFNLSSGVMNVNKPNGIKRRKLKKIKRMNYKLMKKIK